MPKIIECKGCRGCMPHTLMEELGDLCEGTGQIPDRRAPDPLLEETVSMLNEWLGEYDSFDPSLYNIAMETRELLKKLEARG